MPGQQYPEVAEIEIFVQPVILVADVAPADGRNVGS